ncbi:hypothetical protein HW555_006844 [Spodoptera exigua]|uniref:Uncharacterized protein n=1 Tax=Spodoptera exigua TaxID=7107 RepID=A0A835GFU5_SPOEX|nr:hypothetical protein HW555_006844 [Spodoptera exigua]
MYVKILDFMYYNYYVVKYILKGKHGRKTKSRCVPSRWIKKIDKDGLYVTYHCPTKNFPKEKLLDLAKNVVAPKRFWPFKREEFDEAFKFMKSFPDTKKDATKTTEKPPTSINEEQIETNDNKTEPSIVENKDKFSKPSIVENKDKFSKPSIVENKEKSSKPSFVENKDKFSKPSIVENKDRSSKPSIVENKEKSSKPSIVENKAKSSKPSIVENKDSSKPSFVENKDKLSKPKIVENKDKSSKPSIVENKEKSSKPSIVENKDKSSKPSIVENKDSSKPSFVENKDKLSKPKIVENKDKSSKPSFVENKDKSSKPSIVENKDSSKPSIVESKDKSSKPSIVETKDINDSQRSTQKRERPQEKDELEQSSNVNNQAKKIRLENNQKATDEKQNTLKSSHKRNSSERPSISDTILDKTREIQKKDNSHKSIPQKHKVPSENNADEGNGNTKVGSGVKLTEERAQGKETVETAENGTQTETDNFKHDPTFEQLLQSCGVKPNESYYLKNGQQIFNLDDVKFVYNTIIESKIKFKSVYEEIKINLKNAFAAVGLEVPEFCGDLLGPMSNTSKDRHVPMTPGDNQRLLWSDSRTCSLASIESIRTLQASPEDLTSFLSSRTSIRRFRNSPMIACNWEATSICCSWTMSSMATPVSRAQTAGSPTPMSSPSSADSSEFVDRSTGDSAEINGAAAACTSA